MGGCRHVLSFLTASRLLTALRQGAVTGLIAAFGALGCCPGGCRARPLSHRLTALWGPPGSGAARPAPYALSWPRPGKEENCFLNNQAPEINGA